VTPTSTPTASPAGGTSTIYVEITGPGDLEPGAYAFANLYKNYSFAGSATLNDVVLNQSINSGQQMQVLASTNSDLYAAIYIFYLINNAFIDVYYDYYNVGTPDLTAGSNNNYSFICGIEAP
jgi:hypothetical protein